MSKISVRVLKSYVLLFLSFAGLIMSPSVVLALDLSEEAKQEITEILDWSQKELNIPGFVALITNFEKKLMQKHLAFKILKTNPPCS